MRASPLIVAVFGTFVVMLLAGSFYLTKDQSPTTQIDPDAIAILVAKHLRPHLEKLVSVTPPQGVTQVAPQSAPRLERKSPTPDTKTERKTAIGLQTWPPSSAATEPEPVNEEQSAEAAEQPVTAAGDCSQASVSTGSGGGGYVTGLAATRRLYTSAGHDHLAASELDPGRLAPLTAAVQEWMYNMQHPRDCRAVSYMVYNSHSSGIGSNIHVAGFHAAHAWRNNRLLLWGKNLGVEYTDPATCGDVKSWRCHFRPESNCSVADAEAVHGTMFVQDTSNPLNPRTDFSSTRTENYYEYIPVKIVSMLRAAGVEMKQDELKYWWRAQTAAYFARLNDAALDDIRRMRQAEGAVKVVGPQTALSRSGALTAWPLPPGLVSAHVRHGDKGSEMKLVEFKDFMQRAELLVRDAPFSLRRAVFVSTEDPKVLKEAADTSEEAKARGWAAVYYELPRVNDGAQMQIRQLNGKVTAGGLARLHLMQLLMALECDAWVGTRGSNWNRLIDELRCIWVDKCTQPYVDVSIGVPDYDIYNW